MEPTSAQKQEKPTCNYCGKQLHGREGKKYCNVDCKNNFNSRIRSDLRSKENEFFPKAFNQIKVNFRILNTYKEELEDGNGLYMEIKQLVKFGFDPDFCTNAYIDYRERLWKSCNNYYWHDHGDKILIKYMQGCFNRNQ